jgi:SAM-dependent methyltransferase
METRGNQMLNDPSLVSAQYSHTDPLQARIALHQRFSTNPLPWTSWMFDQLSLAGSGSLLEVGCGPADLWLENQHRLPANWTLFLSDLQPSMVNLAKTRVHSHHQIRFIRLDTQRIPFPDDQFDLVIANHMLYHVPDLDGALAQLARVLKPDGRLAASTGGPNHMQELRQVMSRHLPGTWFEEEDSRALSNRLPFNLENGGDWLDRHFRQVQIRRYPNELRVTELGPLLAYIRSRFPGRDRATDELLKPVSDDLEEHIAREGAFRITIEAGCILGRKR